MKKNNLLAEAIVDAKTVRDTALKQAQTVLEEAFAPRIQSMLSAKLQEEMDSFENEEEDPLDDLDLEEILSEIDSEMEEEPIEEAKEEDSETEKVKEQLQEALGVIKSLRKELHETNLLSAKLLYLSKILSTRTLNESQKVKMVKTFDKAESVKEAKLIYESLQENFSSTKPEKTHLKEHLSFASKSTGVPPKNIKQQIIEGDPIVERMKILANISKH